MATLTVTYTAGSYVGASLRALARTIEEMALNVPDQVSSGASTTVVFNDSPATGKVSVQITGGPYQSGVFISG